MGWRVEAPRSGPPWENPSTAPSLTVLTGRQGMNRTAVPHTEPCPDTPKASVTNSSSSSLPRHRDAAKGGTTAKFRKDRKCLPTPLLTAAQPALQATRGGIWTGPLQSLPSEYQPTRGKHQSPISLLTQNVTLQLERRREGQCVSDTCLDSSTAHPAAHTPHTRPHDVIL